MNDKIKIFVIGHKPFGIPKSDVLVPVIAGAKNKDLSKFADNKFLRDDIGENISDKNSFYSELTAQYYVMKNIDVDYYGFFHYRRYLNFSEKTNTRPYVYFTKDVEKLGNFIDIENAENIISKYDLLLPRPEHFHMSVKKHYETSKNHIYKNALQNILDITKEIYTEYLEDIDSYIEGYENYLGNMYIMKKEIAYEYFNFLFNVFEKFDSIYKDVPQRTQGFLSERLFGVFFNHMKRTTDIKYKFLQRVDVLKYYDKKLLRRLSYCILPPSSKFRAMVKSAIKK